MTTMTLRTAVAIAAVAVSAGTVSAAPQTFVVDNGHSEASFKVRHLLSKTPGRFNDFGGRIQLDPAKPESSSVEFRIRAESVDTDLPDRDKHLRTADFFDVANHPEIVFKSESIRRAGKDLYNVTGLLSIRGIEKRVTLPVTYHGQTKDPWGNERAGFSTAITLDRKDFGMVWNKALDQGGFILGDEVWVTLEIEAIREKTAS
jgi:polyisoprenoid-binding protein YceI